MAQVEGPYTMPALIPRPRHHPPQWSDHVLIHAVQVAVCVAWVSYMSLVLVGLFTGYGAMSTIYSPLHPAIAVGMSLMVIVGSVTTIWGVVTSTNRLDLSWKVHQAGLLAAGGGWFIFAVTYAMMPGAYWFSVVIGISQFVVAAAGFISVLFVERTTRAAIRDQGLEA